MLQICDAIDRLLDGGMEIGCITNFYGVPASGKTNIALMAACAAARKGKKVIFVDTESGFSIERLKQIAGSEVRAIANNIILLEPKSWSEQVEQIKKMEKFFKGDVGLIIVDSISALWRLEISDESAAKVNKELAESLALLSIYARKYSIPVIITNQVYEDITTGKTELSSKNIVKWWSKNLIELSKAGGQGRRIARVIRARSLAEGRAIEFEITGNGLRFIKEVK